MKGSQRWNILQMCPLQYSNSGGSDLWSNALPTRPRRGPTGTENISEIWIQYCSGILNCVYSVSRKCHVQSLLNSIDSTDRFIITPNDIAMAIRDLKRRKSVGFDLLASEHYIHINWTYFSPFIYFVARGHLSVNIMKTIIVPLIKSQIGDASDKNNYRLIALVTYCIKVTVWWWWLMFYGHFCVHGRLNGPSDFQR